MINKLLLSISGLIILCSCNSEQKAIKTIKTPQINLIPATANNCIQTEGDYLTAHYCINITNIPDKVTDFPVPIIMRIDQLSPLNKKDQISAVGKWAFEGEPGTYKQYGYKATAKDRYYEIDWSKDTTYFRIWNKDRTKLIEEEPVIKGPESLLKE